MQLCDPGPGGSSVRFWALMVPLLLLFAGKNFGISGSFRDFAAICAPRTKICLPELRLAQERLEGLPGRRRRHRRLCRQPPALLRTGPLSAGHYFSVHWRYALAVGGMMVGFGTRYANGCTSGHSIMGMSSLQVTSLIATICFFIGGLIMTWLIMPLFLLNRSRYMQQPC